MTTFLIPSTSHRIIWGYIYASIVSVATHAARTDMDVHAATNTESRGGGVIVRRRTIDREAVHARIRRAAAAHGVTLPVRVNQTACVLCIAAAATTAEEDI